jgi:hexosaminidase
VFVEDTVIGNGNLQVEYMGTGWNVGTNNPNASGQSDHYSYITNDTATLRFNGTQARYYAALDCHHGKAGVSVDGGAESLVDLYSPMRVDNVGVFTTAVLPLGPHTLRVRVTGIMNPESGGTKPAITVDGFDVAAGCALPPTSGASTGSISPGTNCSTTSSTSTATGG